MDTNRIYYASKRTIGQDGKTATTERTGSRADMRHQFHLFCDSCDKNEAGGRFASSEFGILEGSKPKRKNRLELVFTMY